MMKYHRVVIFFAILLTVSSALKYSTCKSHLYSCKHRSLSERQPFGFALCDKNNDKKSIRYDNVGDPIYDSDDKSLGGKLSFDPITATLIIFGVIAFNFFVVANL